MANISSTLKEGLLSYLGISYKDTSAHDKFYVRSRLKHVGGVLSAPVILSIKEDPKYTKVSISDRPEYDGIINLYDDGLLSVHCHKDGRHIAHYDGRVYGSMHYTHWRFLENECA